MIRVLGGKADSERPTSPNVVVDDDDVDSVSSVRIHDDAAAARPRFASTALDLDNDGDSASSVRVEDRPRPTSPPPPTARHRRSSTLGSSVTDDWTNLENEATSSTRVRRHQTHRSDVPSQQLSPRLDKPRHRRTRTYHDAPSVTLNELATPKTVNAHMNALVALRCMERMCRRAEQLLSSNATVRSQRRIWTIVNAQHRIAVASAQHIRLWAASFKSEHSNASNDPDVASGLAALPTFHTAFLIKADARRERRRNAIEHARLLAIHLCDRQSRMLEILSVASGIAPPVTKRNSYA